MQIEAMRTGAQGSLEAIEALQARYAAARSMCGTRGTPGFRHHVRDVVVVGSASRGGSSLVAELLRRSTSLTSLRGEVSPFLALRGLSYPFSGTESDALGDDQRMRPELIEAFADDLARDCGSPTDVLETDEEILEFATSLTCRLTIQWPALEFDVEDVHACVRDTLRTLERTRGWVRGRFGNTGEFHAHFLVRIAARVPGVDPLYYDIDRAVLADAGVTGEPRLGPPGEFLIEEPPFITITPWRRADPATLSSQPLVIKTPSNVYRLPFLQRIFPEARIRVVHLTRNAAASINGLYDGWRYGGFFSHALPVRLSIRGYTDRFPEWGHRWWKFDLPPGWREYTDAPLEEVCLWQWQSAHKAITRYVRQNGGDEATHRVRFEDIVNPARRAETLSAMMRWIGASDEACDPDACTELPVVMATQPPEPARWRKREDMILPLIERREVQLTMENLGYVDDPDAWG